MIDEYKTIKDVALGEFKDRGSKFFAYAFPADTEKAVAECLEKVKKEHV